MRDEAVIHRSAEISKDFAKRSEEIGKQWHKDLSLGEH